MKQEIKYDDHFVDRLGSFIIILALLVLAVLLANWIWRYEHIYWIRITYYPAVFMAHFELLKMRNREFATVCWHQRSILRFLTASWMRSMT
ncbi:hypothetical protein DAPPUDRAFT_238853 [Daphnia pulex]|uniref:Uncharacterized protein n=1 Tax=Daphnia pulex TaxID=6669 RepID=E9G7L3_DAPPU|nr:hypothetical protein DAPPUDRAFT_238853 [Daphnia pulex]|eukprot:EFX84627.1 hypothetical protein DAPPUDRAFT_238853 [Daphnia pulex]